MFVKVASLLALVAAVVAQSSTINTPTSVVQCQPVQITWTATNTPVFISIIPGGQAGAAALRDFGQQTGQSMSWTCDIASGTSLTWQMRDSTGAVFYTSPVTVQASNDASCLNQSSAPAGSSSAPATTPVASSSAPAATSVISSASVSASSVIASASSVVASSATAPATTSRATSSTASVVSASRSSTASGAAASSTPNAALPTAKVGLTGLLGLAAAVVMA